MPFWLTRATTATGTTIWFPHHDPSDPLDTGGFTSHTLPLSQGGVYDVDGDDRPARGLRRLTRKGMLRESSKAAIGAAFDALAVGSGLRCAIWRQNEVGDRADWCTGRIMVDAGDREPRQLKHRDDGFWLLDTTITLELQDAVWHGTRHGIYQAPLDTGIGLDASTTLDDVADTTTLTTSPQTIVVTNDGNMPVSDPVLTLLAGSADITAFGYTCGRAKCSWTGLLKAGNSLIVDGSNAIVANQTVLTAPAVAGATSLTVANAAGTGWVAGGRVRMVLDDLTTWEGSILSLTGTTTVNLVTGIPGAAASGRALLAACYSGFARDPVLHSIAPWLQFAPGNSSLIVTKTGGGVTSTLTRSFWDAFA